MTIIETSSLVVEIATVPRGARSAKEVAATGFEPATARPPAECATRLRHAPKRATGIEPALEAWKASVQPQHFARVVEAHLSHQPAGRHGWVFAPSYGGTGIGMPSRPTKPATVHAVTTMSAAAAQKVRERGRAASKRAALLIPLVVGVLLVYRYRITLFGEGADQPVRLICALALVALGWWFARDAGRAVSPALFKRMEPPTAGTVSFLIR